MTRRSRCARTVYALAFALASLGPGSAAALPIASPPSVSIQDATVEEGSGRLRELHFPVVLDRPTCHIVRLRYETIDGTATTADHDYVATTGTLIVRPAQHVPEWQVTNAQLGGHAFVHAFSIAATPNGIFYVVDTELKRITKFASNGTYISSWGSRGFGDGQFQRPAGIAVSPSGTVLVTDIERDKIQEFTADGAFVRAWGSTGTGPGQFRRPLAITVDPSGNSFVADLDNARVQKFDSSGNFLTQWGGRGDFSSILDVAADPQGNVFVSDNRAVRKFDGEGRLIREIGRFGGAGGLNSSTSLAVDGCGNLYVANDPTDQIIVYDNDGRFLNQWQTFSPQEGEVQRPEAIAVDGDGNVYLTEVPNFRMQKFRPVIATAEVVVPVRSDVRLEGDETLTLRLFDAEHAVLTVAQATGTIMNDDDGTRKISNLVPNPSFETSLTGWKSYGGATLDLHPGEALKGVQSLRVSNLAVNDYSGVNDSPNVVDDAVAGTTYLFNAWIKSDGAAGMVRIRVREYLAGTQLAKVLSAPVALSDAWQRISINVIAAGAGSTLDLQIVLDPFTGTRVANPAGAGFLVDNVSILAPGPSDNAPVVVAPPTMVAIAGDPLEVVVMARDPDGEPITSLTADLSGLSLGTGAAFVTDATHTRGVLRWNPSLDNVRFDPYFVTFTAGNGLSEFTRTAITVVTATYNVLGNGTFGGTGTVGWKGHNGATLEPFSSGHNSDGAMLVIGPQTLGDFGANDSPYQILSQGVSTVFVVTAWVRSEAHTGTARFRLREYAPGGTQLGAVAYSEPVTLSPDWQKLMMFFTTQAADSKLDLQVSDFPRVAGERFIVDDVAVRRVWLPPATQPGISHAPLASAPVITPDVDFATPRVYPNPVRTAATLAFATTAPGRLRVQLFDASGRLTRTIADDAQAPAGVHRFEVRRGSDAARMAPGIYFYRVETPAGAKRGRFVILE